MAPFFTTGNTVLNQSKQTPLPLVRIMANLDINISMRYSSSSPVLGPEGPQVLIDRLFYRGKSLYRVLTELYA